MFFDYTIQTTQTVASVGPIVSYAKYVKDQYSKSTAATVAVDRAADELLAAVLSAKHSENGGTSAAADVQVANGAAADVQVANGAAADGQVENRAAADDGVGGRRMRLYRPLAKHLSYDSEYWKTAGTAAGAVHGDAERADAFGRRSDFPQLAAYRAPFPPKSVLDVMKYVTGTSHRPPAKAAAGLGAGREYMVAQESRYVPIRPAEEVNRFLPDADAPPTGGSKRFRNKFGPPVFLTPPIMAFPDDFMKPPNTDAKFSMDFVTANAADVVLQEGSASVPSHTGVVFHQSSGMATGYPVPDAPAPAVVQQVPKKVKNGKPKNKKPISVMVDIYPLTDHEHEENEQGLHPFVLFAADDTQQSFLSYRPCSVPPLPSRSPTYNITAVSLPRTRLTSPGSFTHPRLPRIPGATFSFSFSNGDPMKNVHVGSFAKNLSPRPSKNYRINRVLNRIQIVQIIGSWFNFWFNSK